jgi:hypothetical protein
MTRLVPELRLSAGLEMNTTWAAYFSGMPIRPVGFKAIADLKAFRRLAFDAPPDAPSQ